MQQLVFKDAWWMAGNKREILEHLNWLQRSYGNISVQQLLKLLGGPSGPGGRGPGGRTLGPGKNW